MESRIRTALNELGVIGGIIPTRISTLVFLMGITVCRLVSGKEEPYYHHQRNLFGPAAALRAGFVLW